MTGNPMSEPTTDEDVVVQIRWKEADPKKPIPTRKPISLPSVDKVAELFRKEREGWARHLAGDAARTDTEGEHSGK